MNLGKGITEAYKGFMKGAFGKIGISNSLNYDNPI